MNLNSLLSVINKGGNSGVRVHDLLWFFTLFLPSLGKAELDVNTVSTTLNTEKSISGYQLDWDLQSQVCMDQRTNLFCLKKTQIFTRIHTNLASESRA